MKCQHLGCKRDALYIPRINVPAQHWPIDMHTPAQVLINLPVCARHFDEVKIKDFLTDKMREIFEMALRDRMPPDFDRAFLSKIKIGSKDYNMFKDKL